MRPHERNRHEVSVQSSSGGERTSGGSAPRLHETLSQFLARILDQLSVSAWLPAAILVTYIVVAACLRDACGQFHKALATLTSLNAATIILITGSVILTTTLTQAFEFEAIRVLEGYWGPRWLPRQIAELRSQRHARWTDYTPARRLTLSGPPTSLVVDEDHSSKEARDD